MESNGLSMVMFYMLSVDRENTQCMLGDHECCGIYLILVKSELL